ncbi:MAG: NAD(P)/FAD-dependent oxidoreductase [Pseudomonadota bacterium]
MSEEKRSEYRDEEAVEGPATDAERRPVEQLSLSRRDFIKLGTASGVAVVAGTGAAATPRVAEAVRTSARIVIVGGGAGGLTVAARLSHLLAGARITLLEPNETHHYQPGYTLVGTGIYDKDEVLAETGEYVPGGVEWVRSGAAGFDPEASTVTTTAGDTLEYDYLVVATGCELRFDWIEGMSRDLVGREGIGSNYAGAEGAAATWEQVQRFMARGGEGVFTTANTPIKCAGAPLKATFLTEDLVRREGTRDQASFNYFQNGDRLFSVDIYHDLASRRFEEKGVGVHYHHELKAIDPGRRRATFVRPQEGDEVEVDYDYIHVTPPMSAPKVVRESDLAWQEGSHAAGGWMEVDQYTLRHRRYDNVFGIGDVVGTPIGKTAATVRGHAPVVADNLVATIQEKEMPARFDGYTSCPLITGVGSAALVEFNYELEQDSSLPFFDQTDDRWMWWQVKVRGVKPLYYQMLRGRLLKT